MLTALQLAALLTTTNCTKSPKMTRGCAQAVNALLYHLEPPQELAPSEQTWEEIASRAIKRAIGGENESRYVAEAVNAFLAEAFDPHTQLATAPETAAGEAADGFGISISLKSRSFVFVREDAQGLRRGDKIVAINGVPVATILGPYFNDTDRLQAVANALKTSETNGAMLEVLRGNQPRSLELHPEKNNRHLLEARMLRGHKQAIGYIRLREFRDRAVEACAEMPVVQKMRQFIAMIQSGGAKGFILDLRNNPGGQINMARCLAGLFLKRETLVASVAIEEDGRVEHYVNDDEPATALPLVVLINEGSASASELVAGALQDHGRAYLVGTRTYGKGTAQAPTKLVAESEVFLVNMTVGYFYLPSGRSPQIYGVEPDFNIPADEFTFEREAEAHSNALAARGPRWMQPRPSKVGALRSCAKHQITSDVVDPQLASGKNILECLLEHDSRIERPLKRTMAH